LLKRFLKQPQIDSIAFSTTTGLCCVFYNNRFILHLLASILRQHICYYTSWSVHRPIPRIYIFSTPAQLNTNILLILHHRLSAGIGSLEQLLVLSMFRSFRLFSSVIFLFFFSINDTFVILFCLMILVVNDPFAEYVGDPIINYTKRLKELNLLVLRYTISTTLLYILISASYLHSNVYRYFVTSYFVTSYLKYLVTSYLKYLQSSLFCLHHWFWSPDKYVLGFEINVFGFEINVFGFEINVLDFQFYFPRHRYASSKNTSLSQV